MDSDLLDYTQASEEFNLKKGTLAWLVHERRIPHIRLGRRLVRFDRRSVEAWLREREVTTNDIGGQTKGSNAE